MNLFSKKYWKLWGSMKIHLFCCGTAKVLMGIKDSGSRGTEKKYCSYKTQDNIIDSVLVQCFAGGELLINDCGRIFLS